MTNTKRAKTVGKVAAILVGALGLYIIGVMLQPLWRMLHSDDADWVGMLFMVLFTTLMFAFGGYCLFVAFQAWSNVSAIVMRRLSLIVALVFCIMLLPIGKRLGTLSPWLQERTWWQVTTPIVIIAGGIFYWLCSKLLIKWLALPEIIDWSRREKAARHFFWWLAFFLYMASFAVILDLAPKKPPYDVPKEPWGIMALLGSILPAYLIYKVGVYIFLRKKSVDIDQEQPAEQAKVD